ncbi:hypothetical protein LOAG_18778 [Loa loa]|uniref:Uncharacterized protein n=1 Tax=Loa loa TaxID=7209 RepID=A0A1S0UEI4_LOALO|nr:hypothetical protein LOAG_18778 [Loa loa]EJD73826.1 hypothetical protein LOAG_18778 [Loa loa]
MTSVILESIKPVRNRLINILQEKRITNGSIIFKTPLPHQEKGEGGEVTIGEQGIFNLIYEAKETVVTLTIYQKEIDSEIQKLTAIPNQQHALPTEVTKPIPPTYTSVNLLQLSLSVFNGDPRHWREFWSSFNAAVHSQTIPEIQKLN